MQALQQTDPHWQAFLARPARYAHPKRLVSLFDGLIGDEVAAKLAEEDRFADRLSVLLVEHYGLAPAANAPPPGAVAQRLALASPAQLDAWVRQCGAVYFARAVVREVELHAVMTLRQDLGDEAYAAAIANRDLAGPNAAWPEGAGPQAAAEIAGLRCLAAWCDGEAADLGPRIRLKLPENELLDEPAPAPFDSLGPRIVARVIGG